eukprot:maker-scaffold146_size311726-snap-gene-1.18 protein:Tk07045 transcript:maker-scaffold146_size311726-snap-gene-1.18-mRNA-1 annotation:"threonine synthase-like 2"
MKYCSTRGGEVGLSFEEVLFAGYAKDGGLYLPESFPKISPFQWDELAQMNYTEMVTEILSMFIGGDEIPKADLKALVGEAHASFDIPEVVGLQRIVPGLTIAELFHGTTFTFKDLALSVVGKLFDYFLKKRQKHLIVVVATSGDTGSAAIEAVRTLKWVDIVVLLPRGRCTPIQERQMTTVMADNVHVYSGDGTSDDLDVPIKKVFQDESFVRTHNLCSINSINVARVLVQSVHYFYCFLQMQPKSSNAEMEFIVPTGACGNITGGLIARMMGLPIKLVPVTNENDIVTRTLRDGNFSLAPDVHKSWACAIDIQCPYNLERIFYLVWNGDAQRVGQLMAEFESQGGLTLPSDLLEKLKPIITDSLSVSEKDILASIRACFEDHKYTICPHTAVGYFYASKSLPSGDGNQAAPERVILSTASPLKFPEALDQAR